MKNEKPMACPSVPPAACSAYTSCQCIDSGSFYFYQCDGLWCNDQCSGCHKATASEQTMIMKTEKSKACPSSPPAACSAYTSCQCIDSGSFYFYQCDGLWCNDQCSGCHQAEEGNASEQAMLIKTEKSREC